MPNFTPVYRLPYVKAGEVIDEIMERTRYMSVDRQLEALFTFLGDGIITGWNIQTNTNNPKTVIVTKGSGVVSNMAVATSVNTILTPSSSTTQETVNYIYVKTIPSSPHTAAGEIISLTTTYGSYNYLLLGKVTVSTSGTISIDTSTTSGRRDLTPLRYLLETFSTHVHNGSPGQPDKIDLLNHVKGVLSSANIQDLSASKITSGIIDKQRFRLSHGDLLDTGTLTHVEIDGLIDKFQSLNKLLFGDVMTANLIQLVLSLKHVWADVDDYFYNFISVIPGIGKDTFLNSNTHIDLTNSDAEIDYENHRIRGVYVESKEIGQQIINNVSEFSYKIDGSLSYDTKYIRISGRDSGYAYGYGYGFGTGSDYFDVLLSVYTEDQPLYVGVTGTGEGYGLTDVDGNTNWETNFAGIYGYGYGYEQLEGFSTTLTSTDITLIADYSNIDIHDKQYENYETNSINDDYIASLDSNAIYIAPLGTSAITKPNFLILAADASSGNGWRSTLINNGVSSDSDNLRSYTSAITRRNALNNSGYLDQDKGVSFLTWDNVLDMSSESTLNIYLTQVKYERANGDPSGNIVDISGFTDYATTFDSQWSPDVGMDLIVEATYDGKRYFYKYSEVSGTGWDNYRFFDIEDNAIFESLEQAPTTTKPAMASKQADISSEYLNFIGGYTIPTTEGSITITNISTYSFSTDDLGTDECVKYITGIYLYTQNDYDVDSGGYYSFDRGEFYNAIYWPQGQRNTLSKLSEDSNPIQMDNTYTDTSSKEYRESSMLVDIDKISISGPYGFNYNEEQNKIEDITVVFPIAVDFNSISWISSEPSDSIVYIQIKKYLNADGTETDTSYNNNVIYTNKGAELNLAQNNNSYRDAWFTYFDPSDDDYAINLSNMYKVSGSDFPTEYQNIRGVSFRIVLLPSSDLRISPVLNSITINYTSNTSPGSVTVSTENQWAAYRNISAIEPGTYLDGIDTVDYITIDVPSGSDIAVGKVKNLIYGTNKAIAEIGNIGGSWSSSVKTYTGSDLPLTIYQQFNGLSSGIQGYVTHLKKMTNGNIIFLDQDASRIIELDMDYNIEKIICSEYAYKNTSSTHTVTDTTVATAIKAIYNPDLGDYGVVYVIFSHELKCWNNLYGQNVIEYDPTADGSIDLSKIRITYKASTVYFTDCIPIPVDRGTICFVLDESTSNFIENNPNPELKLTFSLDENNKANTTGSCVLFNDVDNIIDEAIVRLSIEEPSYNMIFCPIQGIVAFDVDEDGIYYILKKAKPYSYDSVEHAAEPWYVSFNSNTYWYGWNETTYSYSGTIKDVIPVTTFRSSATWEPNFFLSNVYGYRGSIQKKDDYLLMTISGEINTDGDRNGILIFKKLSTGKYGEPADIILDNDGSYPMAAKFDPETYDSVNKEYEYIYIALSDLSVSSNSGLKSRVIKVNGSGTQVLFSWGEKSDYDSGNTTSYAITVNDIIPLSYNDGEVIIST